MKKNNYFKVFIIILVISFLLEGGYVILKNLYIKSTYQYGDFKLKYNNVSDDEIIIDVDKKYIEKLVIDYSVDKDVDFTVTYTSFDEYNLNIIEQITKESKLFF